MLALGPFFPEQADFEAHKPYREVISSIPQLAGSLVEPGPGAHWSASPPAERQRCPRTRSSFNTACP
jgi:hypothetical protein